MCRAPMGDARYITDFSQNSLNTKSWLQRQKCGWEYNFQMDVIGLKQGASVSNGQAWFRTGLTVKGIMTFTLPSRGICSSFDRIWQNSAFCVVQIILLSYHITVNSVNPEMSINCYRHRHDMWFEVPKSSDLGYDPALTYNLLDIFSRSLLFPSAA